MLLVLGNYGRGLLQAGDVVPGAFHQPRELHVWKCRCVRFIMSMALAIPVDTPGAQEQDEPRQMRLIILTASERNLATPIPSMPMDVSRGRQSADTLSPDLFATEHSKSKVAVKSPASNASR